MDDIALVGILVGAHLGLPAEAEGLALLLTDADALHRGSQTVAGLKLLRIG